MYLGDGCVSSTRTSYQLVVVCDAAYPDIIDDCATAMTLTLLPRRVGCNPHPVHRCVRVVASSKLWPQAFPQHGPGRKHNRKIELAPWQREVVDRFPQEFLRGLLHSDGCRTVNRFKTTNAAERARRGVRVSALVLLEPVGRHPRAVLRVLRPAGDPLDAVEPAQHLRIAPPRGRAARLIRAGEVMSAAGLRTSRRTFMTTLDHSEHSTLAACIAQIAGASASDVPLDEEGQRAWLAERGLGLVPVRDAATFSWAGPWIARRPARDGSGPRAVVMFGVPSGAIWDPADTAEQILDGFVVSPLDVSAWLPVRAADVGAGVVEALVVAPAAEASVAFVDEAVAVVGHGLQGDRYAGGNGTFGSGRPGSALTLVDAAVLDSLGRDVDHRRNVVVRGTDLNALVGRAFRLGEVRCRGRRLCEPCAHLDRLNGGGVLRPLVHRGGLRADVVQGGTIRVGDRLVLD
jgi:hypothetical protein